MAGTIPDELILARLKRETALREQGDSTLAATVAGLGGDFKRTLARLESRFRKTEAGSAESIARITQTQETLVVEGYALARTVEQITARLATEFAPAALVEEVRRAAVAADTALAEARLHLRAEIGSNRAEILTSLTAYVTDEFAEAIRDEAVAAATAEASALVATEATARASADSALASSITSLTATVAGNTAAIATEVTARTTADTALASSITALTATVAGNTAAISAEATARTTADTALASSITSLTTTVAGNTSAISAEVTARTTADTALTSSITTLTATVSGNTAAISAETTARTSADSALTSSITSLTATVGANTTAITTEASARAAADGQMHARWGVNLDVNGRITGKVNLDGSNASTEFTVLADKIRFFNGTTDISPFTVSGGVVYMTNVVAESVKASIEISTPKITGGEMKLAGGSNRIVNDTADGADNSNIRFNGGGSDGPTRGGQLDLMGNEFGLTGYGGAVLISPGDAASGHVRVRDRAGADRFIVETDGSLSLNADATVAGALHVSGAITGPGSISVNGAINSNDEIRVDSTRVVRERYGSSPPGGSFDALAEWCRDVLVHHGLAPS